MKDFEPVRADRDLAADDCALARIHRPGAAGYFREAHVGRVRPGNPAVITLMTYPDSPPRGVVDSIGWAIYQSDGSAGPDLLPNVSPTFQWIRLAQRVPVRVHLEEVPEEVELRVGTTASVLVMTGSVGESAEVPPVPRALQ